MIPYHSLGATSGAAGGWGLTDRARAAARRASSAGGATL